MIVPFLKNKQTNKGTPLESGDLLLEIQQSWGEKNINGNKFKLINENYFVRVMFRGVTEIADGIFGGLHTTPNVTADAFCELIANEYQLNKKRKYMLLDVLQQTIGIFFFISFHFFF